MNDAKLTNFLGELHEELAREMGIFYAELQSVGVEMPDNRQELIDPIVRAIEAVYYEGEAVAND